MFVLGTVHVIRERGYEVGVAVLHGITTVRVHPLMHGPKTINGQVGWDDIDKIPLPRKVDKWID